MCLNLISRTDLFLPFQERAGAGAARAAHEGERDRGAGELQHLGQPLGHRAPLLRLHPTAGTNEIRQHLPDMKYSAPEKSLSWVS